MKQNINKKIVIFIIIIILIIVCYISRCSFLPAYQRVSPSDGTPMVIKTPDGLLYRNISSSNWKPLKKGVKIAEIGWTNNLLSCFGGIYQVEGDVNNNVIIIVEPFSEFEVPFLKSSISIPKFNLRDINGIQT